MTAAPPWPRNTKEDALWYARAVIADTPHHDDLTVIAACEWIEANSPDATERTRATDLRVLIQGERTCK